MNLIEQLGGYEKAKEYYIDQDLRGNHTVRIRHALLEYRRQHNIYEKGDWVFYKITGTIGDFIDHIKLDSGHPYCRVDFGLCDVGLIMLEHIRHATDEEIKAGKRLEVKA